MDERQKNNINSAMAKALVVLYVAVVIFGILSFLLKFNITVCIFSLVVAIAVPLFVLIFSRNSKKKATFPMTLAGLVIYPNRTKKAKIGRIKAYALDSLGVTTIFILIRVIFDLQEKYRLKTLSFMNFDEILNYAAAFIGEMILFFTVYFITDYIVYEYKSKKYCKENLNIE